MTADPRTPTALPFATPLAAPPSRIAIGRAFGTFGELLQGRLPASDTDFLVTLPIDRWSTSTFRYQPEAAGITVNPAHKSKARLLATTMLAALGASGGGILEITTDLPEGKGFASSSADLVATARAVGRALRAEPDPARIEDLLREVEPTDGVMYDGSVAFRHREVRLHERIGHLPPMTVVGVDEGGEVDTVEYNRVPKRFTVAQQRAYARLLELARDAAARCDPAGLGRVATGSALMNQRLRPKRCLQQMIAACQEIGGLGVVAAHSGTVLGILLSDDDPRYIDRLAAARRACAALPGVSAVRVDHCLSDPLLTDPSQVHRSWPIFEAMPCSSTP